MVSKNWSAGDVVTATDFNTVLADQVLMVFADGTARDAGFGGAGEPTLAEGMFCFLTGTNEFQVYNGSAWKTIGDPDVLTVNSATGRVTVAFSGDPAVLIQDDDATDPDDATMTATLQMIAADGNTAGLVGFANSGNLHFYVENRADEGDILFRTETGGSLGTRMTLTAAGALELAGDLVPSSALSNRNACLNPDMKINQRNGGASGGPNAGYVLDQFQLLASGGTRNYNVGAFTMGSPAASGYASPNYASIVMSSMSTVGGYVIFRPTIEDVRTLAGETVVISFYAKAASGTPKISVEIDQYFGSGGSPSADTQTDFGQVTLSTSWARYSVTGTIPSVSGKTLGTTANTSTVRVNLWLSAGSTWNARTGSLGAQNNTFDIWGVQLERGSNATPLEVRSHAEELARCQRYFYEPPNTENGAAGDGASLSASLGYNYSTTQGICWAEMPVPMRATPSIVSAVAELEWATVDAGARSPGSLAIFGDLSNNKTIALNLGSMTSLTSQMGGWLRYEDGAVAAASLQFSAEL
jgi:hypothetical protein